VSDAPDPVDLVELPDGLVDPASAVGAAERPPPSVPPADDPGAVPAPVPAGTLVADEAPVSGAPDPVDVVERSDGFVDPAPTLSVAVGPADSVPAVVDEADDVVGRSSGSASSDDARSDPAVVEASGTSGASTALGESSVAPGASPLDDVVGEDVDAGDDDDADDESGRRSAEPATCDDGRAESPPVRRDASAASVAEPAVVVDVSSTSAVAEEKPWTSGRSSEAGGSKPPPADVVETSSMSAVDVSVGRAPLAVGTDDADVVAEGAVVDPDVVVDDADVDEPVVPPPLASTDVSRRRSAIVRHHHNAISTITRISRSQIHHFITGLLLQSHPP